LRCAPLRLVAQDLYRRSVRTALTRVSAAPRSCSSRWASTSTPPPATKCGAP
jgi:hypothetical protein